MKIGRVLTVLPIVLLASSAALAQEVQVTIGGPPPPPPPPPPPRVVIEAPPPPPPYYYGRPRPMFAPEGDVNRPHLRWAIGATGGPYIGGNVGGAGGLWGQLGVQINQLIGVYYQTHAMIGAVGLKNSSDVYDLFVGGIWNNEVMVDFTFADVFQVGVGPSFDVFSVNNFSEGFFGLDARIGVGLGRRIWGHRSGFMLGVDVHPTFVTDAGFPSTPVLTSVLLTLGGGWW